MQQEREKMGCFDEHYGDDDLFSPLSAPSYVHHLSDAFTLLLHMLNVRKIVLKLFVLISES